MNVNEVYLNICKEFHETDEKLLWDHSYKSLDQKSRRLISSSVDAHKPKNKYMNRYRDVNPYDSSRVILKRGDHDYINASLVEYTIVGAKYILTQGPLPATVGHFWLMIWEQNCRAIVMLNKLIENGEVKCHKYWPSESETYSDVKLSVEQITLKTDYHFSTRKFRLVDLETSESREVTQFHYTTWPDFGVPICPISFIHLMMDIHYSGLISPELGPPVVHCSAGIGRSGTFVLAYTCLLLMEKQCVVDFKIFDVLMELRKYRMGLVQTPEQLRFSYIAVIEGARQMFPALNKYEPESFTTVIAPPPLPMRITSLSHNAPLPPLPVRQKRDWPANVSASTAETTDSEADDEEDDVELLRGNDPNTATLRHRQVTGAELSIRVTEIKKKMRDAERQLALRKKSLVIMAVIIIGGLILHLLFKYSY